MKAINQQTREYCRGYIDANRGYDFIMQDQSTDYYEGVAQAMYEQESTRTSFDENLSYL